MLDILQTQQLRLASKSPRRSELLSSAGIPFQLLDSDWPEVYDHKMDVMKVAGYLSYHKALNAAGDLDQNEILLTADTIVIKKGKVLGKPKDKSGAVKMLKKLSNTKHTVVTGITLMNNLKTVNASCVSKVWIDKLSKKEIQNYIDNYNPLDKAGAYGIQDWMGICKVRKIRGSYPNIMGLPVHLVYAILSKW